MVDLTLLGIVTAFFGGVISFLSPCVLPLVPGYVSYVAGRSFEEMERNNVDRLRALLYAVWFVLGFSVVFVAFGASASALGGLLLTYRYELGILAGVVILLFGVHLLGFSPLRLMERDVRFHLNIPGGKVTGAFLLGIAFAFGWTPCIGPVLGAILTMTASSASLEKGTVLLAVYSLGLGVPFLLAALFTEQLLRQMKRLSRMGRRLQQGAGVLLIVMGALMITGQFEVIAYWLLETFPVFATIG
ncbi:MAG TPA: cytochrome c biogenesis protein CcdA [Rhodospirillales bacterium]|nr:cytochrome c biogenesis protein CcdA [Rhodospirillales bacterium]